MIQSKKHIKELYDLNHRHDTKSTNNRFDYENKLFKKTFSNYIFRNDTNFEFLNKLQEMQIWTFETILIARNFWNYTVDKYWNGHNN